MTEKQKMMEEFGLSDEREWRIFCRGLEIGKAHKEPSEDTLDMIAEINEKMKCNDDDHKKFENALFGNKEINEKGIKEMVTEMYGVFNSTGFAGRLALKIFIIIGTITGAILGLITLFRQLNNND